MPLPTGVYNIAIQVRVSRRDGTPTGLVCRQRLVLKVVFAAS